ncbi:MAG: hypothetical protein WBC13_03395, partial [Dokdonella sp.]
MQNTATLQFDVGWASILRMHAVIPDPLLCNRDDTHVLTAVYGVYGFVHTVSPMESETRRPASFAPRDVARQNVAS